MSNDIYKEGKYWYFYGDMGNILGPYNTKDEAIKYYEEYYQETFTDFPIEFYS